MKIRIGTRGSKLALVQTEQIKSILEKNEIETEVKIISTKGDVQKETPLPKMGWKGIFTAALDEAMLKNEIDIAVHSAKDLPSSLNNEIEIVAFTKREPVHDVLLAINENVHFENANQKFVIGTSSVRRMAFLKKYFPNVEPKIIRGNVDTRIEKVKRGDYDGIILAYAGVKRMGFKKFIRQSLNAQQFVPAGGQGALAITAKKNFFHNNQLKKLLNHTETEIAVMCERAFLNGIGAECHTPAFALASLISNQLTLTCGVASPPSSRGLQLIQTIREGFINLQSPDNYRGRRKKIEESVSIGKEGAKWILSHGGKEILDAIEN